MSEQAPSNKSAMLSWLSQLAMGYNHPEDRAMLTTICAVIEKPAHEREPPHCSTCGCGLAPEPRARWTEPAKHCQNGGDVCLAGNADGVCRPDDSCDIDDGMQSRDPRASQPPAVDEQIDQTILRIEECELSMDDSEGLIYMLRELKSLRAAQPPVPEWQPIETAPKDGTSFIARAGNWLTMACWNKHRRDWCSVCNHYCSLPEDEALTHWLPRPSVPTKEESR